MFVETLDHVKICITIFQLDTCLQKPETMLKYVSLHCSNTFVETLKHIKIYVSLHYKYMFVDNLDHAKICVTTLQVVGCRNLRQC